MEEVGRLEVDYTDVVEVALQWSREMAYSWHDKQRGHRQWMELEEVVDSLHMAGYSSCSAILKAPVEMRESRVYFSSWIFSSSEMLLTFLNRSHLLPEWLHFRSNLAQNLFLYAALFPAYLEFWSSSYWCKPQHLALLWYSKRNVFEFSRMGSQSSQAHHSHILTTQGCWIQERTRSY